MPNDKLSRQATALLKLIQQVNNDFEELHAFHGPSECGKLIAESFSASVRRLFNNSYIEAKAFFFEFEKRTSPKEAYDWGITTVLEAFPEFQYEWETFNLNKEAFGIFYEDRHVLSSHF